MIAVTRSAALVRARRAPRGASSLGLALLVLLAGGCSSEADDPGEVLACCAGTEHAAGDAAHPPASAGVLADADAAVDARDAVDVDATDANEDEGEDELARIAAFLSGEDSRPLPADDGTGLAVHTILPDFELVGDDGRPFTRDDLLGDVWVVDFIFTSCPGPCPAMSSRFAQFAKDEDFPARLLSVSVDPERDTPAVLASYRDQLGAQADAWRLLTGPAERIQALAEGGFRMPVNVGKETLAGMPPLFHSGRFALVDAAGRVRGYYAYDDKMAMRTLEKDAAKLVDAATR